MFVGSRAGVRDVSAIEIADAKWAGYIRAALAFREHLWAGVLTRVNRLFREPRDVGHRVSGLGSWLRQAGT